MTVNTRVSPKAGVFVQLSGPALQLPPERTVGETPTFGSISVTQYPPASGSWVWPLSLHGWGSTRQMKPWSAACGRGQGGGREGLG